MKIICLRRPNIIQPLFKNSGFKQKPIVLKSKIERWRIVANTVSISDKAKLRLEWMIFYETAGNHDAYVTAKHFAITAKTFYKWRKRFADGKVKKLEDDSTRPDHLRQWTVTFEEECRIKKLRQAHLHYGKKKIKKLYKDEYGETISTWKIERVTRKHDLYPDPVQQEKNRKKFKNQTKKNRIQNLVIEEKIFFLFHLDTIVIHWGHLKRYILTACDHTGKIAYARMYSTKSSRSAKDFLYRLHFLIDAPLAHVQTDNGTEFYAEFEEAITVLEATHWFSRNRTPEDNAIAERFNQTLQDEWLNDGHFTPNIREFNLALTNWLEEYNFVRPHQTLDYETPMSYYLNTLNLTSNLLPMYSARTFYLLFLSFVLNSFIGRLNLNFSQKPKGEQVMRQAKDYILVALDVDSIDAANELIASLRGEVGGFKIGMELFNNEPTVMDDVAHDVDIFWDQKYNDIPNSVAGAARAIAKRQVWMFNVMAMGGKKMMQAAVEAGRSEAEKLGVEPPLVVAVTLLTSIDQQTLGNELLVNGILTQAYVAHLACLAQEAGLDGVVASAQDVEEIRDICGPGFLIVTPGIRRAGSDTDDQKRVGTPGQAVKKGADYLVIGRDITKADDKVAATRAIVAEIETAIDEMLYHEVAIGVFGDGGIQFGAFRLKSHKRWPEAPLSPIFVNLREKGSSQEHEGKLTEETVDLIGQLIVHRYGELIAQLPGYIAGIPSAGEPIVDAVMRHLPENATVQRLYMDKTGAGDSRTIGLKEGETYTPGATVLLIDDLITRADSKIEAAKALRQAGMVVEGCLVVVDRQQGGPEEAEAAGLKIISIYTMDDLLRLYLAAELISQEKVDEVHTYQQRFDEYTSSHEPVV